MTRAFETDKIKFIFERISWLDKNRWKPSENSGTLINYSTHNLTANQKLLTHLISYISDRQMLFRQIWDKGGFVYSDIISAYSKGENPKELLSANNGSSFLKQQGNGFKFCSKTLVPENNLLIKNYGLKTGDVVEFTPRYYPSDIKSIMQTLFVLKDFDLNLMKFFEFLMNKNIEIPKLNRIAFGLYLLSYYNIGQPKRSEIDKIYLDVEKNKEEIIKILKDDKKFLEEYNHFDKKERFKQKRMWCTLRDFIKNREYLEYLKEGFHDIKREDLWLKWESLSKEELELPGDVWNNNPKFNNCLFEDIELVKFNKNSSEFIRNIYENFKNDIKEGYPEMFDVTFDFVSRMCSEGLCDFCLFNKKNKISELCVKDKNKFCPVLLISCGYIVKCSPKECILQNDALKI